MHFCFDKLGGDEKYKLLTSTVVPRPIAWVVSCNADGRLNCAPFSFFNAFSGDPPVICIGVAARQWGPKDTAANIQRTGEFVVNLVPERLVKMMNITAIEFGAEINELAQAQLETAPSRHIKVPRIAESPVAFECERTIAMDIGNSRTIIVAKVLSMYVADDAVLDAGRCHIDTPKLHLVGRMHGSGWYARTEDCFQVPRIAEDEWWAPAPRG